MKKIAFHANQLCLRGTAVAMFAYAKYNEEILGNKSIILSSPNGDLDSLDKFKERFEVYLMPFDEYEPFLKKNEFDFLYVIKGGGQDSLWIESIPTIVHAVFQYNQPHGYKYVYVSDWLCKNQGYDIETHSLPHICEKLPQPLYDLRSKFGISGDCKVFGCYGGPTQFDLGFVKQTIINIAQSRDDIKFIFMNIEKLAISLLGHFQFRK